MSSPLSDSSMSPHSLLEDLAVASPESLSSSRGSTPCSAFPSTPTSITAVPSTAESEKKPVKKRKSWGQELPTPTTNLAPRKRAKTAEEKEQRRVERVLRNRAAAQKSREVKKQQLEKIEKERDELKEQNERLVASNKQLQEMLDHIQGIQETTTLREASCGQSVKDEPAYDFDGAFTLNPNNLLSQDMKNESSLWDFVDNIFTDSVDIFGLELYPGMDLSVGSDADSGLAASPESCSILSPDSILDEFIDCERAAPAAFDEQAVQLGFGASTDSDGL
ncbi:hypothetical protein EDC01DRAFT_634430 [Geopyxis carbonaria]|nr:hypothetical protein EDC01DRAFT_634430 [Geopyxis carbonaria]